MTGTPKLKLIKPIELTAGSEPRAAKPVNPELIAVRYPETAPEGPLLVNAFQYCFLNRKKSWIGNHPNAPKLVFYVDPTTICQKRREVVAAWIKDMLQYKFSKNTADSIGRCLEWIDERELNSFLYEEETAKQIYQEYTTFINDSVSAKEMSYPVANKYQCNMRAVLEYSTGLPKKTIKKWAQPVPAKNRALREKHQRRIRATYSEVVPIEIFVGSDPSSAEIENLVSVAIRFPKTTTAKAYVLYIFQYCFLKREKIKSEEVPPKTHFYVNPETLCHKRKMLVAEWARDLVRSKLSHSTAAIMGQCFDWLDDQELNGCLYDEDTAKTLYKTFTTYLNGRIYSEKNDSQDKISQPHASRKQCSMRTIIQYSTGVPKDIVKTWATPIPFYDPHPHHKNYEPVEATSLRVGRDHSRRNDFKPENVVVEFSSAFKVPAFRYCYLDRLSIVEKKERIRYNVNNVRTASLSKQRCSLVLKWVKDMLSNHVGRTDSTYISSVLDWIDISGRSRELHELGEAKKLYKDYTAHLQATRFSKDIVSKSDRRKASQQQKAMRYLVALAISTSSKNVQKWASEISPDAIKQQEIIIDHFSDVDTYELIANSTDRVIEDFEPERVILRFNQGRLLIYRYCYLKRGTLFHSFTNSSYNHKVDQSSLCPERCKLIKRLIERALTGVTNFSRLDSVLFQLNVIDKEGRHKDLLDLERARQLYRNITDALIHQSRLSRVGKRKGISPGNARLRQNAMIDLISLAIDVSKAVIESWARRITERGRTPLPQPRQNEDEAQRAYEIHRRFFSGYCKAIINKKQMPLVIKLSDLGFDDYIAFHHLTSSYNDYGLNKQSTYKSGKWRPYAFSADGFDDDEDSVVRKTAGNEHNPDLAWLPYYREIRKQIIARNWSFDSDTTRVFANRAMKHFGYMLMYVSGCNAGHLAGLVCEESFLPKDQGSNRIVAFKNRPITERQELTVDNKFQKEWRQMIGLRKCMTVYTDQPLPAMGLHIVPLYRTYFKTIDCHDIGSGLAWPDGAPNLSTKTPRKIKIQKNLELTGGDIDLVAGMVSNTPKTIRGHYAFNTFEDSASQMSQFFDDLRESANLRVSGVPEAPIVEDGEDIPPGKCIASSMEDRAYIEGVDESRAPELTCGGPLGCLFCASFGIRDDYEDIHRLLSVKAYIKIQSQHKSQTLEAHTQKFLPAVARIDEIIDAFASRGEPSRDKVERADGAIAKGDLDEFWFAQVNALLDATEDL